jgi:hypothetical protein
LDRTAFDLALADRRLGTGEHRRGNAVPLS